MKHFLYQLFSLLTRALNVVVFFGYANFTTSARAYSDGVDSAAWERFRKLIDWLFSPFEKNHCSRVWDGRVARARETLARDTEIRRKRGIE